jgi:hypothetical protein
MNVAEAMQRQYEQPNVIHNEESEYDDKEDGEVTEHADN